MERITCTLEHTHQVINDNTLNDPRYQIHFETNPRHVKPMNFDIHNDLSIPSNHIDQHRKHAGIAEKVELLSLKQNQLPCETVTDPTELPLQRESVSSYDLGKLFQSSGVSSIATNMFITILSSLPVIILL